MAQGSPQKLPRGKADSYTITALSDTLAVKPLLSGLSIATCNPSVEDDIKEPVIQPTEGEVKKTHDDDVVTVSTRMSCNCCSVIFSHRTEQKAHFKSDWHRYNLKQQLRGEPSITEDQFETMTGEVSSISGSEDTSTSSTEEEPSVKASAVSAHVRKSHTCDITETSDSEGEENSAIMAATRKHPKVFLRNGNGELISLYRCVLYHKKTSPSTPAELLSLAEQAKTYTRVAVVMLAGGHFSAAIFDRSEPVVHKTFHRYVVRAKRGFVQSVRDNQGSAPKSGGASLRRYNEAALAQEIQELLTGWSQQLQSCHLIFLRTSAYSRHVFFGTKSPVFRKDDTRVRTIPFSTGRPTFNEAKRVHQMLTSVECFGDESLVTSFVPVSPPRHLHPDTGQLVVRPDTARTRAPRGQKAKDKKEKADAVELEGSEKQETVDIDKDDDQSEGEIELVEAMQEIRLDDLQEFSVSLPKRNKKRKKKGGQKESEKETTDTQQASQVVHTEQLSEEETQLKNLLYTCCKSGDISQLSQLLEQLTQTDHSAQRLSMDHCQPETTADTHQPNTTTTDSQTENRITNAQSEGEQPLAPQISVLSQNTCSQPTQHKEISSRTCETNGEVSKDKPVCVEQISDPDHSEQRNDTVNSDTLADSCVLNTSNLERSVPQSAVKPSGASHIQQHRIDPSQKSVAGEDISHCMADASEEGRFRRVVLGLYGDRGYTLLHVAASAGKGDIITALMEAGCDPCIRENSGKTPYTLASTKDVRNVFRRFRGNYPDRYDYDSAQIPSALTADMEAERKQREAEKKKLQKKAKQERLKERKAEEAKAVKEKKEKDRFLALSDREKRALAAEKRLLSQASEQGASVVLNRCFQCAVDISGKVPFEYMQFQFCSPKCLQQHRMKGAK